MNQRTAKRASNPTPEHERLSHEPAAPPAPSSRSSATSCARRRCRVDDLILPLFVRPGRGIKKEIASMPGNFQLSVDRLVDEVGAAVDLGVRAFILFGIPAHKDATGSSALEDDGIVQQALRALREAFGTACCSSPTSASASTPTTAIAAS